MTAGSTKGVCSGTCGTDADCATGSVCFEVFLSQNSTVRLCSVKCLSDAGCDPGLKMSCSIYEDPISETVAFACQRTGGTGFGVEPPPGEGCASGVVIDKVHQTVRKPRRMRRAVPGVQERPDRHGFRRHRRHQGLHHAMIQAVGAWRSGARADAGLYVLPRLS